MTEREALKFALEALEVLGWQPTEEAMDYRDNAIDAIKEVLAQPEQETMTLDVSGLTGPSLIPANWNSCSPNEYTPPSQPKEPEPWVGPNAGPITKEMLEPLSVEKKAELHAALADIFGWGKTLEQEPSEYVQRVIDALYENSDPVSVEAAELLERMAQPEQEPEHDQK